jgi:PQQ-dependent catabolism-associated CXXCW motif protein
MLGTVLCALLWVAPAVATEATPSTHRHLGPDGYRMSHYRAPTPATVPHAVTLDTIELAALIDSGSVRLVDVQAVVVRPETAEFGFAWLPNEPRYNIPGSVWLPNVGYGQLEPHMDAYFRHHLRRVTSGRLDRPLVFYCVADCWMSWNAVQRAHRYGYHALYWYRGGTDAWQAAGRPLQEGQPEPLAETALSSNPPPE